MPVGKAAELSAWTRAAPAWPTVSGTVSPTMSSRAGPDAATAPSASFRSGW